VIVDVMHNFRPLLIGALVLAEVALWQWRMVIAHRGRRIGAMMLGFVGAVLQITAITQVVANVRDPLSIAAYAGGVGCGVLFGLIAGERLTPGALGVAIVSSAPEMAVELWRRGWAATAHEGVSPDGPTTILFLTIARRDATSLRQDVRRIDPGATWTARELHAAVTHLAPAKTRSSAPAT
jgi:uncharacterized protein YebE (UPF0316 family)